MELLIQASKYIEYFAFFALRYFFWIYFGFVNFKEDIMVNFFCEEKNIFESFYKIKLFSPKNDGYFLK